MTSEPGSHFSLPSNNNNNNFYHQGILFYTLQSIFYLIFHLSHLKTMEGWHCCFHFTNEERILVGMGETEKGKNINLGGKRRAGS